MHFTFVLCVLSFSWGRIAIYLNLGANILRLGFSKLVNYNHTKRQLCSDFPNFSTESVTFTLEQDHPVLRAPVTKEFSYAQLTGYHALPLSLSSTGPDFIFYQIVFLVGIRIFRTQSTVSNLVISSQPVL
jgi:hypothetical protein